MNRLSLFLIIFVLLSSTTIGFAEDRPLIPGYEKACIGIYPDILSELDKAAKYEKKKDWCSAAKHSKEGLTLLGVAALSCANDSEQAERIMEWVNVAAAHHKRFKSLCRKP